MDFATAVHFPSHRLILRKSKDDTTQVIKGITDADHLKSAFDELIEENGSVFVETGMRAKYNPTRMEAIGRAAQKLADKMLSCCSQCTLPGFGVTDAKNGLKCSLCGLPTKS